MQDERKKSVFTQSAHALKWSYLGKFSSLALQFIVGLFLARVLGPEPFGIIAIALFVQGLGNLFSDAGLGSALVQANEVSEEDVRSVFTAQIIIGAIATLVVMASAGPIAAYFGRIQADSVIRVLSLGFVLQSVGMTSVSLMRRHFKFKTIQLISINSYVIGYLCVGLPMAYQGYGVWSLVFAYLVQVTLNSVLCYLSERHRIFPLSHPSKCRFWSFGGAITFNNVTSWLISNMDTAIIGRLFDVAVLGLYNRAFNIVNMPMYAITSSIQTALLSTYSRVQARRELILTAFVASVSFMSLLLMPMYVAVISVSDILLPVLYGKAWKGAAEILNPLCLAMVINGMLAMAGPVLTAIGKPRLELYSQLVSLLIGVPLVFFCGGYSISALVWGVFVSYLIRYLLLLHVTLSELNGKLMFIFGVFIKPALLSFFIYLIAMFVRQELMHFHVNNLITLIVVMFSCAVAYVITVMYFGRWLIGETIRKLLESKKNELPVFVLKRLGIQQ